MRRSVAARIESVYVYALLEAAIPPLRLSATRIEIVKAGRLFAAVERRRRPPVLSERTLRRQHDIVVRLAGAADAILPVRFGTHVPSTELDALVEPRARALRQALRGVRGRVQMTIRLYGPSLARAASPAATSGREYLRQRASAARPVLPPAADAIRAAVRTLVDAETIDGGRGAVQVCIHHLVRRARVSKYVARLESALAACEPRPEAALSGPWPPFAFTPDVWAFDDAEG